MAKTKVLILEDEQPAAERLTHLLADLRPDFEIDAVYETGAEAIDYLRNRPRPQLIFSDVELADGLCFDVFAEMDVQTPVIFTTAYNEYAIRAFETHAIDYLLKPLHKDKLERALGKYESRANPSSPDFAGLRDMLQNPYPLRRFVVKYGQKMVVLKLEDVAYFYSMDKSTFAVDKGGKSYPLDESLNALEKELSNKTFFRINRNMIVHIDSLGEMRSHSKGRLRILLRPEHHHRPHTIVSVERSPEFRKWLNSE